jgi:hypothetical protein
VPSYCVQHTPMSTDPIVEISEHYESQVRTWRAQRVGWCVLAAILVAAVLGGFGPGLLGTVNELDASGLQLQYDRCVRYEAPASLHIELPAAATDEQDFWIDASWIHAVHLETVQPEPLRVRSEGQRVRYTMSVQRRGAPTQVSLHFEPEALGSLSGSVALEAGAPLRISQFVYP